MKLSNQQMNPMQTQAIMQAYDKESLKMEMGTEMSNQLVLLLLTYFYLSISIYSG